jgi:amino acid adenylation domain-containing protein
LTPFTAAIIGAGSLAARCAELWRKRGHQLAWLVAGDEILASQRGDADLIRTASDLTGSSAPAPVDFLFSIVNGAVLPPPALRLGRRMAINFHDGPLPRYAGVHATSWAILAGEQTHGVTWHVLTPEVDAGPVLKQRLFAILRGDTALHLDATCHELGFELFAELVDALEQGTAQGHAQDGSRRTYFGRHQKARGAGLLDLRSPADALARSVAAHTLREEANRFGVPKLLWKDGCLVPVAARALPSPDDAPLPPAGVVLGFEPGGAIRIATGDGQLAIGGFRDLQGRPWVPSELAARQGIGPGHALELPSPSLLDDLTAQAERSSRHEADWVRGLAEARGAPVPVSLFAPAAASSEPAEVRLRVEGGASADELIAAMAAYVGRFADHRPITLGLTTPPLARAAEGLERFLCAQAPLTVAVDPETTFSELQAQVEEGRALWERRGPALEDCRVRYAALRGKPADLSVAVAIGAGDRPTGAALTLVVPAGCGQPTLRAGSGRERLTLEALQLMGEQLATLLDSARRDRHRAVRDLELLRPEERDRLLRGWNTTRVDWGEPAILARFARWVQETPGASAVVADDGELSYSELDARADALARHLADRGVTRDSPVAVALPRSAGLVTSLIALLKLCATYVPLDPDSPPERASRMIEIAGARHLLCSRRGGPCLPRFRGERVELETLDLDARREPLNPGADPHIAYVMFTSGSTGAPKGVLVPSAGLGNRLYWSQATYPIGPGDAILQNAAVGFDISVWEMLFPLLGGARLCVAPAAEQGLVVDLWSRMQRHGVTFLHLVPSVLRELLRETSAGEPPPLRHVVCGGEILPLEVCRAFKRRYLTARLHHAYGPTEASISVTHWEYEEGQDRVLLGKPIANAEIYVLDERQQPVPPGVAGELYIGGLPLARGYAGAPEATRERFVPNPFAGAPGPRLYRTGDRGRWRSDGALEFLGRLDDQIKLRGHRIEPGEIEGMLSTLPNVREAAVRAHRPEGRDEPELVAYVASDGEVSLQPAQLRADLSKVFPPHMIPTRWVLLDALPRLPNGKLDRAALPRPAGRAREADGREPRSELERAVARTWESLLGVERVFADDDFFVLGGHSLLAARLLTWARERFGARLSLRTVFDHPTLAAFAGEIASASREAAPESGGPLTGTERWPLSPAQRRLWFFHELLGDERGLYNIPLALRLRGALDANALGRAFSALQARHPILRARFHGGGSPHMTFAGPARLVVRPRLERRADASPPSCEELLGDRAFEPFDLAVEPPIRAELVPLSTFDHVLALVVHHIAFDEGSARVFLRELGELYQSEIQARPSRLSPLARHYGDLAAALLAREASPETAESLAFWAAGLAGLPKEPPLPRLSARASRTYRGARLTALVPPAVAEAARRVGEQHRATLFMVLLAAFQVALYRISGEEDVVVGTPLAGRDEPGADALVGLFINMAAVRVRLAPERTFAGALAEVRERVLAAMEHGRVSFDRVVDHLGVPRELGAHPVFEVLFALRDDDAASGAWGELQYELRPIPGPFSMYDLALTAAPGPGGIELELEYSTDLLDPALAAGLGAALVDILEYVTGSPLAPIGEAPLVSAAGEAALRAAWRGAELATAGGGTCLDLFLAQADRAPDALALLDGQGGSRSYAALAHDARASASALAAAGVRPGDIVLLALDRSAAQVAAVLGAWAAGAGYAPVSPDDPPARIASVGRQTRAALAVAAPALAETLRSLGLRTLTPADLAAGPGGPLRRPCADDIAYVIYTSGSSGEPKGVQIEHRALANYVSGALRTFELGAGDRLLQFAALSFDASAEEIFTTLASGAALVLRDDEMLRSPAAFFAACEARGVTALDLPTSFFHHLVGRFGASPAPLPSRLRLVVVGGERLLDPYVRAWRAMAAAQGKRIRLLNTYGPTETTIVATAADVTDELSGDDQAPIGRPVPNAWVAVLDALGHPVPPGVPGELWIGGAGLARGYLGRADLTAERFVSDERHGRRYRTGDRVRSSADGLLSYIGRADRQVKVRGFRVELDEIDRVLLAHPSVADAASVHEEGGEPERRGLEPGAQTTPRPLSPRVHAPDRLRSGREPAPRPERQDRQGTARAGGSAAARSGR